MHDSTLQPALPVLTEGLYTLDLQTCYHFAQHGPNTAVARQLPLVPLVSPTSGESNDSINFSQQVAGLDGGSLHRSTLHQQPHVSTLCRLQVQHGQQCTVTAGDKDMWVCWVSLLSWLPLLSLQQHF